jgi:predicted nuclease of restriction endonuclease-like (RecB) superfamily
MKYAVLAKILFKDNYTEGCAKSRNLFENHKKAASDSKLLLSSQILRDPPNPQTLDYQPNNQAFVS